MERAALSWRSPRQPVTEAHSPKREDERARIQRANGWVTTETEIPIGQLKRMALFDEDIVDILETLADRYQPSPKPAPPQRSLQISRVCREHAASRAIGGRDIKPSHHGTADAPCEDNTWDLASFCPTLTMRAAPL